ncbi:MAG: Flp family type IVb pilin [Phycisphaerae bacterium]|jgi:Flp pilus assembly pilin Flp
MFKNLLKRLHNDERGAVSVEQILLLALIFLPIIILLVIFKNKIVGWFQQSTTDLEQSRT